MQMVKKPVKKGMSSRAKIVLSFVLIGIVSLVSIYYAVGAFNNWSEGITEKSGVKKMTALRNEKLTKTTITTTTTKEEKINMCDVVRLTFEDEDIKMYVEDGKYCYYTEENYIPICLNKFCRV